MKGARASRRLVGRTLGQDEDIPNGQTRALMLEDKYSLAYGVQEKINPGLHQGKSKIISLINERRDGCPLQWVLIVMSEVGRKQGSH